MSAYDDNWKPGRVWTVINANPPDATYPAMDDILIFTGNGGGSGSFLVRGRKPVRWGSSCTLQSDGTVKVKRDSDSAQCTITRSTNPVKLTCRKDSDNSVLFTANEVKENTTTSYNANLTPTRVWRVETIPNDTNLVVNDILIFTGTGETGSVSELNKSTPVSPSWGSGCTYNNPPHTGQVRLDHGIKHFKIKRVIQLDCDLDEEGVVTGAVWTAEEGG